jgi:hypothetical protein
MEVEKAVFNAVENLRLRIQQDLASKGIDNKKTASNSLHTEQTIESTRFNTALWGVNYIDYLNEGRAPGKFPPVDAINDWVATKPVPINPYLVGRKIALFGTAIYQDRSKGIELDKKIVQTALELREVLTPALKQDIIKNIKLK